MLYHSILSHFPSFPTLFLIASQMYKPMKLSKVNLSTFALQENPFSFPPSLPSTFRLPLPLPHLSPFLLTVVVKHLTGILPAKAVLMLQVTR